MLAGRGRSFPSPHTPRAGRPRNQTAITPGLDYQGAGTGRRTRGWSAPTRSPNDVLPSVTLLRDRSRAAARNDGFAKAALNKLVSNIIGTGIKPMSQAPDTRFREAVHALWLRWTDESAPDGLLDFYGQQVQIVRGWLEGGDMYARLRFRRATDGLSVPLQIQVLEPDFCPLAYTRQLANGHRVRAGIEFDQVGRRVAYYFHPERPGDPQDMDAGRYVRVEAASVIPVYDPLRAGQLRGIPQLATVLLRLYTLDGFDDATLFRQQLQNLFVGFVTHNGAAGQENISPLTGQALERDDKDQAIAAFEPGTFQDLLPGEDVKFSAPPDPAGTYPDFMRQQLIGACAGAEVPYEVVTGDLSKVNDRTVRVILNDFRRRVQQWQHHIVAFQLCRPLWRAWVERAIVSGALEAPGYFDNPEPFLRAKWIPQGWPYINPVQEVQAQREAVRAGFTSRSSVVSETGEDAEAIDVEQAADNARADRLKLIYDSDPRRVQKTGAPAAQPTPGDDTPRETAATE